MEKLISMVDFVLNGQKTADYVKLYDGCFKYANFLKQPLTLGMFVPCDLDGNVLEPKKFTTDGHPIFDGGILYQEAKERVLFEGWKLVCNGKWGAEIARDKITGFAQFNITKYKDIESLMRDRELTLSESARKHLGL